MSILFFIRSDRDRKLHFFCKNQIGSVHIARIRDKGMMDLPIGNTIDIIPNSYPSFIQTGHPHRVQKHHTTSVEIGTKLLLHPINRSIQFLLAVIMRPLYSRFYSGKKIPMIFQPVFQIHTNLRNDLFQL